MTTVYKGLLSTQYIKPQMTGIMYIVIYKINKVLSTMNGILRLSSSKIYGKER